MKSLLLMLFIVFNTWIYAIQHQHNTGHALNIQSQIKEGEIPVAVMNVWHDIKLNKPGYSVQQYIVHVYPISGDNFEFAINNHSSNKQFFANIHKQGMIVSGTKVLFDHIVIKDDKSAKLRNIPSFSFIVK